MTERERLIELLCSAPLGSKTFEQQYYKSTITKIADYLLSNGVIVPPVKVGDTVYEFFDVKGFYSITEFIVEDIVIGVNTDKCNLYCKSKHSNSEYIFYRDSFGKTVFFTREEAEKALEEMKKND